MANEQPGSIRAFIAEEKRKRANYAAGLIADFIGLAGETTLLVGGYRYAKYFDVNSAILLGAGGALLAAVATTAPRLVKSAINNIEGIIESTREIKGLKESLKAYSNPS